MQAAAGCEPDKSALIARSALTIAAAQGVSCMSLREVAAGCGVSLGLVQYYFSTKAALVAAVDELVLSVVTEAMQSRKEGDRRGPAQLQNLFAQLLVHEPDALTYLARALGDDAPVGAVIFDRLLEITAEHAPSTTDSAIEHGPDQLWAAINPLVLAVGVIMFRSHIERNLHQPLDAPEQLARWDSAAASLIGEGYFRPSGG
ncbi:MAG: TetR family transcriptional regulator [Mycobacterium sp.]